MSKSNLVAAQAETGGLSQFQIIGILAGVLLGTLVSALDQTVVGTAMPRIIAQLQGLDRYAWVFTGYLLVQTASMPIWGKLSDLYGRKWLYLGGITIFAVGSLLSGAAQTMNQLIDFRALQGLGAGAMTPIAQAIIGDIFSPAERAKYQGLNLGVYAPAVIVGPLLGGAITDNLSWHCVFYINLPVAVITMVVVLFALPRRVASARGSVDYLGALLLVAGIIPLLLAFTWAGTTFEWISWQIIGLLLAAGVLVALFLLVERRATEPILPLILFRNRIFTVSVLATAVAGMTLIGATVYLALFVQGVLGQSATASGLVSTPMMAGVLVGGVLGGQVVSRLGGYRAIAILGMGIASLGMLLLAQMNVTTSLTTIVATMIVFGLGVGTVMPLFTVIVQNAVERREMGVATALLAFFRSVGGTMGVAILGSFLTNAFNREFIGHLPSTLIQTIPSDRLAALGKPEVLLSPQAIEQLQASFARFGPQGRVLLAQLLDVIRITLAVALREVFLTGAIFMALATLACLFLREIPLRRTAPRRIQRTAARMKRDEDLPLST
jgi:EmrB/QacA subfamily drug resistance transporter